MAKKFHYSFVKHVIQSVLISKLVIFSQECPGPVVQIDLAMLEVLLAI